MRALASSEIYDLLLRNVSLAARVAAHKALVATGRWSQVDIADGRWDIELFALPISPSGVTVKDDRYGNVVIFPDAAGALHYTSDVPELVAGEIAKPRYESPSGNSLEQLGADFKEALKGFVTAAIFGLVVVALWRVALREL